MTTNYPKIKVLILSISMGVSPYISAQTTTISHTESFEITTTISKKSDQTLLTKSSPTKNKKKFVVAYTENSGSSSVRKRYVL